MSIAGCWEPGFSVNRLPSWVDPYALPARRSGAIWRRRPTRIAEATRRRQGVVDKQRHVGMG